MEGNVFINIPEKYSFKEDVKKYLEAFGKQHPELLIFCLSRPLGKDNDFSYDYQGLVLLSPEYKLLFVGIGDDEEGFEDFIDDFIQDIGSLSSNYNYQKYIGRPREWRERIISKLSFAKSSDINFDNIFGDVNNKVAEKDIRLVKYIISLLTGNINDLKDNALEEGENLLDRIRNKIVLFDADQTRFLYNDYIRRFVSVQGLSGTGKTELLLHKLKEIYSKNSDENKSKIFFTCHNIALANEIRRRIPDFFNKMKIDRQINWNNEIWVGHAWGSRYRSNSGLYAYICEHYGFPFFNYKEAGSYDVIFGDILERIKKLEKLKKFEPCLDYILVDESQDFPQEFFDVCYKIAKNKVYTAGDVFQNIFYQNQSKPRGVDIVLNRCYRTDPRTLMFAHTLGLGLKEKKRYNWFERKEWESFGYKFQRNGNKSISLSRHPVARFEGEEPEESVIVSQNTKESAVCDILNEIKNTYPNVRAGDVAIIMIDDNKEIYRYMDSLAIKINELVGWDVMRGIEDKKTDPDKLYLTNANNVKGLEFPFVICITLGLLDDFNYRNRLYTMLTRSFLCTYLIVRSEDDSEFLKNVYSEINKERCISNIKVPTDGEKTAIRHALIEEKDNIITSWDDFMENILSRNGVDSSKWESIKNMLGQTNIDKFDEKSIKDFINKVSSVV